MPEIDALTLSRQGSSTANDDAARILALEARVERLTALVESIWSILESKSSLNENHLRARLAKIMELRETRSSARNECVQCKQKNSLAKTQCIYCGAELPKPSKSQQSPFSF